MGMTWKTTRIATLLQIHDIDRVGNVGMARKMPRIGQTWKQTLLLSETRRIHNREIAQMGTMGTARKIGQTQETGNIGKTRKIGKLEMMQRR